MQREITVQLSRYTTLKINSKHKVKVSAHFIFFPFCEYTVLVYQTGFDYYFSLRTKSVIIFFKVRNGLISMSGFVRVSTG